MSCPGVAVDFRRQVHQLKYLLAEKTLEVDFFKAAPHLLTHVSRSYFLAVGGNTPFRRR